MNLGGFGNLLSTKKQPKRHLFQSNTFQISDLKNLLPRKELQLSKMASPNNESCRESKAKYLLY